MNLFKGFWSLPGGKMENEEMLKTTAVREAKEETGLDIMITRLIGVYSDPFRDPRGRYISVAYEAKIIGGELKAGSDAASCIKIAIKDIGDLAFDHNKIVEDYISSKK
jgi:8-oxo-dGTP diphosphatase